MIKIVPTEPLVPIHIGDSSSVRKLQRIVMVGHPYGYSFANCSGEIVGLSREIPITENLKYDNAIVISAGISPGMTGGPLLTIDGEMIGLTVALKQTSSITDVALPSNYVMEVAAKLLEQHTGLAIQPVTDVAGCCFLFLMCNKSEISLDFHFAC